MLRFGMVRFGVVQLGEVGKDFHITSFIDFNTQKCEKGVLWFCWVNFGLVSSGWVRSGIGLVR